MYYPCQSEAILVSSFSADLLLRHKEAIKIQRQFKLLSGAGKVTIHGLGSLGSQGCWAPWAPYGAGLLGLWAPEGDAMYLLCSQWCWAPKGAGLPSLLGSQVDWAPYDHCSLGSIGSLGSQDCWASVVRGLLMLLGSRGYWAPVITGLPRLLGSRDNGAPDVTVGHYGSIPIKKMH